MSGNPSEFALSVVRSARSFLRIGDTSMKTLLKQAVIAAALATAMSAVAQAPSAQSGAGGENRFPPPPISPNATTSGDARVPANRDSDAVKACANVAASDKEACIARENARLGTGRSEERRGGKEGRS